MKKHLILLLSLTIIAVGVNAQDDSRTSLAFGLKAGANFSNVYDSEGEEFDAEGKLGLAVGAFVAIPIGEFMGVQPEVLFSQKGFKASGSLLGGSYNFTRTTNHLDIPLYFAIKPTSFITILAGPQFSYLFSRKDVFTNGTSTVEQEREFENDNIRKNTLCFSGGIDINVDHFIISGRAGVDLQENNGEGQSTTPRYKNTWLQGTIGYRFY